MNLSTIVRLILHLKALDAICLIIDGIMYNFTCNNNNNLGITYNLKPKKSKKRSLVVESH